VLARLPDVFRCLHARDVRYVVISGVAAIVHGVPLYRRVLEGSDG